MSELSNFLNIIEQADFKKIKVKTTTKKDLLVTPLTFKQQKNLITSGLDGIIGSMKFIKELNDIIIQNSEHKSLKIYDRIPIALVLRNEFKSDKIKVNNEEIDLSDIISKIDTFKDVEPPTIQTSDYSVVLKVPTLEEENRYLSICIEDLKKNSSEDIGKNLATVLSYEIPKFIESFNFGDKVIKMDDLSLSEKIKILDNLPAHVTNKITDFILKVREYDENILTIGDTIIEIDSNFFE